MAQMNKSLFACRRLVLFLQKKKYFIACLNVKPEQQHVAVFDDVVAAFHT
jgi:hypothetical protein